MLASGFFGSQHFCNQLLGKVKMRKRILLICDNREIAESVIQRLKCEDLQIFWETVDSALPNVLTGRYSLIVVPVVPGMENVWKIIGLTKEYVNIPIMVLFDSKDDLDVVWMLQHGATVCLESCTLNEFYQAQVLALVRTYPTSRDEQNKKPLIFGADFVILPKLRRVYLEEDLLKLTRLEYELLLFLARNPGQTFSNDEIYDKVWRNEKTLWGENSVKTCIKTLRKKLASSDKVWIENVRSVGYRFCVEGIYGPDLHGIL